MLKIKQGKIMKYKSLCLALLLSVPTFSFAGNLNLDPYLANPAALSKIDSNSHIQNELASILGGDYIKFSKNFEVLATPYKLKTAKAIYSEGRTKVGNDASAMTLYADGRIYAAHYNSQKNTVRYFTNDKSCSTVLHPTIQVFIKHYPNAKVEFANSNNSVLKYNGGNGFGCSSSTSRSTQVYAVASDNPTQAAAREVASNIWTQSIADSLDMNEEVGIVISNTVKSILTCSANFNLVPKPPGVGDPIPGTKYFIQPGLKYLKDYFSEIIPYLAGLSGDQPVYRACINTAAANNRTALELASLGI